MTTLRQHLDEMVAECERLGSALALGEEDPPTGRFFVPGTGGGDAWVVRIGATPMELAFVAKMEPASEPEFRLAGYGCPPEAGWTTDFDDVMEELREKAGVYAVMLFHVVTELRREGVDVREVADEVDVRHVMES